MYSVGGGRDVLIISADLPPHQPEAVARRPGQLTEEVKQKLLNQGVTSDCQSEVDIVGARCKLDDGCTTVEVISGHSLIRQVTKKINHLLNTTAKDGSKLLINVSGQSIQIFYSMIIVLLYYTGAGRKNTGDWCFEDGFITFRDIAQLYRQSKLRGRILTIVSDCSYSGRWVRDCMEFLDEQGVQPCGHKAREKGILIKVFASCKPNQIPTEYQFSVSGAISDKIAGEMGFWTSKQLTETQTTHGIDSSCLRCNSTTITEPCTLEPGYTWRRFLKESQRIRLVRGMDRGRPAWHYVLLEDDDDTICEFNKRLKSGCVDVGEYGQILQSGWGKDPPNDLKARMDEEYSLSSHYYCDVIHACTSGGEP